MQDKAENKMQLYVKNKSLQGRLSQLKDLLFNFLKKGVIIQLFATYRHFNESMLRFLFY